MVEIGVDQVFRELRAKAGSPQPRSDGPLSTKTCLIAMLPRTGSTALCSLMETTGVLGKPRAVTPFAQYLGKMHNRIHPEFADKELTRMDALSPEEVAATAAMIY